MWVAANCSKLLCLASLSTSNSYSLLCFRSSFAKAGVRKPSCVEQSHREVYGCSRTATGHSSSNQHTELAVGLLCVSAPFPGHTAPHLVWNGAAAPSCKHPSPKVLEPWVLHQLLEGRAGVPGQLLALCYSQQ